MKTNVAGYERIHEYNGHTYTAYELTRMAGCTCPLDELIFRLANKWTAERAMTVPKALAGINRYAGEE